MFGLSHPEVCRLIQELPGAELCKNFRPELSFSRFGPQVVARPSGEDLLMHSDSAYGGEIDRVLGRRSALPHSDFEVDEGGSGRDEMPLSLWHVKAVEPRRGKTLLRSPATHQYHGNQSMEYDEGDEEEDEDENEEDENGDGESTDDDD